MKNIRILVIGIIYNTYPEAEQYLESLVRCFVPGLKILLVDNSEIDVPAAFASRVNELEHVTMIRTGKNLGYLHGARFGYEHALHQLGYDPQWVLVTNVDILFGDSDIFVKLKRYEKDNQLGIIAPSIITRKWKTDLNPQVISRYSRSRMRFYSFLYTSFVLTNSYILLSLLRRKIKGLLKVYGDAASVILTPAEREIFAPHGSCIIFHSNYFEKGGSLQHVAFLFAEELFIAEEASRIGLRVVYAPTIRIDDLEHASTGRFLSRKMIRYRKQSIDAIIGRFYQ